MSIEDTEIEELPVEELIDIVEEDDIPTSEFSVEDTDRMVILGKLNTIINWLKTHGYGTNIFSNGEYLEDYNIDLKLDKSTYDTFILALDEILQDIATALENIPTKTSELDNDSGFITLADIPTIPTKTSELDNDSGFITLSDIPSIPTKTSDLLNDSGFITDSYHDSTKQDTLTFDNTPTENSSNPVKSGGVYSSLLSKTEHYATYSFPSNVSSFRLQIAELGDFDKYDYEFVIHSNTISVATTMYMRFGDAITDLDTDGGSSRIHAYWGNNNEGTGTISSYQSGYANYGIAYSRYLSKTIWGNLKLETNSNGVYWLALIGRTRTGDIEYRLGFNAVTPSTVTHVRFYLGSGNFVSSGGTISVYRTKKA